MPQYKKIPKQDAITKIHNKLENHNFKKAILK